jgi:hypothetical protein
MPLPPTNPTTPTNSAQVEDVLAGHHSTSSSGGDVLASAAVSLRCTSTLHISAGLVLLCSLAGSLVLLSPRIKTCKRSAQEPKCIALCRPAHAPNQPFTCTLCSHTPSQVRNQYARLMGRPTADAAAAAAAPDTGSKSVRRPVEGDCPGERGPQVGWSATAQENAAPPGASSLLLPLDALTGSCPCGRKGAWEALGFPNC